MPLTIKQNGFKFKDSNGDYQGVDVIAETALATQLAAIQGEGTTQIGAVQAKGTEVIASIPADYTDLTEEVDEIKSALTNVEDEVDNVVIISTTEPSSANNKIWVDTNETQNVQIPTVEDLYDILPTDTISNQAIASFSDGAKDILVKSLVVGIDPVQSGSGDPSPENIRPISGWTGLNVVKTGRNLADPSVVVNNGGVLQNDGSYYIENPNDLYDKKAWDNISGYAGQIAVTFIRKSASGVRAPLRLRIYYSDGTYEYIGNSDGTGAFVTYTKVSNSSKVVTSIIFDYGVSGESYFKIQVELGATAHEYEKYCGETIPVSWQTAAGTVYGGELDIVAKKLRVLYNKVTFTGASSEVWYWNSATASKNRMRIGIGDARRGEYYNDIVCNYLKPDSDLASSPDPWEACFNASYTLLIGVPTTITSEDSWKTYLASNNLEVVYPLNTPVEYTLTGIEELETLLGQNNIYADTGDIKSLEYRADIKLYINKMLEA